MDLELRTPTADDLDAIFTVRAQAFALPGSEREGWIAHARPETMVAAFTGGVLVGSLRSLPFGQWFGGRSLPMGGIAGVVVAPEWRGCGVAPRMLAWMLERLRDQGTVVSTLHPATTRLYRGAGWEITGDLARYTVPSRSLARLHRGAPERLRRLPAAEWVLAQGCYDRAAPAHPGWLDRPAAWWSHLAEARFADQAYVYGVDGEDGELAGYVTFDQAAGSPWGYRLRVHDLVALTPEAHTTLWSFLGGHAMQVERVELPGALVDDLLLVLPEQDVRLVGTNRWMHRLVDVPGALRARGWPPGVRAEVHLEVADPVAPWNAGRSVLRVEHGHAEVTAGGTGEVQVSVGALSALVAGRFSASTLAAAGLLHHASPVTLTALDAACAGARPELLDDF